MGIKASVPLRKRTRPSQPLVGRIGRAALANKSASVFISRGTQLSFRSVKAMTGFGCLPVNVRRTIQEWKWSG